MTRILFVQYGNFGEAFDRFAAGQPETYRDQRRSVDFVSRLAPDAQVLTVSLSGHMERRELAPNLFAQGLKGMTKPALEEMFSFLKPQRVILRTPRLDVLQRAARDSTPVLPCFADMFRPTGLLGKIARFQLRRALQSAQIPCVANHSLNASRSLVNVLGLDATRVVPWDWSRLPPNPNVKRGRASSETFRLMYAGALKPDKGVGDIIDAIGLLKEQGQTVEVTLAGPGDAAPFKAQATDQGIGDQVHFVGLLPHADIQAAMHDHDAVIVPSRHSYDEGLPNVIYEGLASRSALMVSDHPAFMGRLRDGTDCLVFKASDPQSLARRIRDLQTTPGLYATLSEHAPEALSGLYVGLEWQELVQTFIDDPLDQTGWVKGNTLAVL